MTTWEVVEEALAHKKKTQKWLAEQLGVAIAVTSNWKSRGNVPAERRREVATALSLTVDQLEGYAPLPWDKPVEWPFEDRPLYDRVKELGAEQRLEIQGAIRKMVRDFEESTSSSDAQRDQSWRALADAAPNIAHSSSAKRRKGH